MRAGKSCCAFFVLCIVAMPFAIGCSSKKTAMVSRTSVEESRPPPAILAISFLDLHDVETNDPLQETVVGTIVNNGDKPVSKLSIRLESLDSAGRVVNSIVTPPLNQTISPSGGQAQFQAQVPRNPAVTGYHAVALAQ